MKGTVRYTNRPDLHLWSSKAGGCCYATLTSTSTSTSTSTYHLPPSTYHFWGFSLGKVVAKHPWSQVDAKQLYRVVALQGGGAPQLLPCCWEPASLLSLFLLVDRQGNQARCLGCGSSRCSLFIKNKKGRGVLAWPGFAWPGLLLAGSVPRFSRTLIMLFFR